MTELLTLLLSKENYHGKKKRRLQQIKGRSELSCDEKACYLDNVKKLYARPNNK
jgi:hypothetical protein